MSEGRAEAAAAWVYRGLWRALANWFDVPRTAPALPHEPGEWYREFKPADGFLRYRKLVFWVIAILIDIAILVGYGVLTTVMIVEGFWWIALIALPVVLIIAIVPDIFGYVAVHLRYDTTWYAMTDRSLRLRRGVWVLQETTITFENVQNVKVQQGPLQRYFGVSDLILETAGAGAASGKHQTQTANQGIIEGVEDAQELRDLIQAKLRATRTSGLGDEDDHDMVTPSVQRRWTEEHLRTLREIRDLLSA